MDDKKSFKEWFWEKFLEWRGATIKGPTAFARYLGIKQQIVSSWLDGKYKPRSLEYISKIAEKYPDIYNILGVEPEPDLYDQVPQPYRDRLKAALTEITTTLNKGQIPPETSLGQHIARETFAKYGFDTTSITIEPDPPNGATT